MNFTLYDSPIGGLLLVADDEGLRQIVFPNGKRCATPDDDWQLKHEVFGEVCAQLDDYFVGKRTHFELKLAPEGTQFQQQVWASLQKIEYGHTCSYQDIAREVGKPNASRAVGAANGKNPIPIIIPCHRVIGADGSLTGFGGGILTKHWLLSHESGEPSLFPFEEWLLPE